MRTSEKQILVLDDEEMILDLLQETFQSTGYEVDTASSGKEAFEKCSSRRYDLLVTDLKLPDINGVEVLTRVKKKYPMMGVILITAYGSIKNAVQAMKKGAFDYVTKPFNLDELELIVSKYFEFQDLITENEYLRSELDKKFSYENIVGKSPCMIQVFDCIRTVAKSKTTVLIQGPSGTGKELVSRAIHYNSDRKLGPFITANCAALPEGLVESELFGHEKGAFTGAYKTAKGRFELAHGGTILLDEVSEIGLGIQAKLLRVIQEREIERVGGVKPIEVDVRIIATTNKNLIEEVREKRFREDLYYRLNVVPITLPSISERREDIPLLIAYFISKFSAENGAPIKKVTEKTMKTLMQLDWPGNVREIENCVERAVVMSPKEIKEYDISHFLFQQPSALHAEELNAEQFMTLREVEKKLILKTLREQDMNRTKTADLLDISVRTLRNKLNEYQKEGVQVH